MWKAKFRSGSVESQAKGVFTSPYLLFLWSNIFFNIEHFRPSYLNHWIANKMLFPVVYKTLVLELYKKKIVTFSKYI